jgi:hypothetical protein
MNQEIKGQLIVTLTEGDIIPATCLRAGAESIIIETGKVQTKVDPLIVDKVYEINPDTSPEELLAKAKTDEEKITLSKTLCGLLEVEHLIEKFSKETNLVPQKIAIFGSGGLTLTILPGRASHDIAIATRDQFASFCETIAIKSHGNIAEISSFALLKYLGNWEERASELKGILGTQLLVLHPLDTVMQKLLRINEDRFNINDKKDIAKILEVLSPSQDTLKFLLTENPNRYRIPTEKPQSQAIKRNTEWFLDNFLKNTSFKEIVTSSELNEENYLIGKGLAPLPLKKQNLQKVVKSLESYNLENP